MLTGIVGDNLDSVSLAYELAIEAVFAVFDILENRFLVLGIPADDVYEASLVAQLAADTLLGIEFDSVIRENHIKSNTSILKYIHILTYRA